MKLKNYKEFINESKNNDSMNVFDMDDTLCITGAKIRIYDPSNHTEYALTPQEFNDYERKPHHIVDFGEFDNHEILMNGKIIKWVVDILVNTMKKGKDVGIITARGDKQIIIDFFKKHGIHLNPAFIFAVNSPNSKYTGNVHQRKQQAFEDLIAIGYTNFRFFDDNQSNLDYAKKLEEIYPNISMETKLILPKHIPAFK